MRNNDNLNNRNNPNNLNNANAAANRNLNNNTGMGNDDNINDRNNLNNLNDMLKVVIHELGHSTAKLVAERKDLRYHCPNESCLMKDANNGFPYRDVTSFCPTCAKAMEAKGFNLDALRLKKQ